MTDKSGKQRWLWLSVALLLALAAAFSYFRWFHTYHFLVIDPAKLYRDGNRSLWEFRVAVRKSSAKTVISLVDDQENQSKEFEDERAYLKETGLEYIRIPIVKGTLPTSEQIRRFLDIASDPAKQPVLYHDNEGIRRAGMMAAAYQLSILGYDKPKAIATIHRFGHSDRTINEVIEFIQNYSPTTRTLAPTTQPTATTR